MTLKANEILEQAARLYAERNAVYGDNFRNAGAALSAFFPEGVVLKDTDEQTRYHLFILIIVKLSRYAVNWYAGGHQDSIRDAAVYCAMLEQIDAEMAERKAGAKK